MTDSEINQFVRVMCLPFIIVIFKKKGFFYYKMQLSF